MYIKNTAGLAAIALFVCSPLQATAQFGGLKVPSIPGVTSSETSSYDLNSGQAGLFASFTAAQSQVLQAQILLAKAFELKELAATLEAEAEFIGRAEVDTKRMKDSMATSSAAQEAIAARMDEGAVLSDEGKAYFAEAIPYLLQGTLSVGKLPGEAQALADGVKSVAQNGSIIQKAQAAQLVGPTASFATAVPGFVRSTYDSYKKVVTYGQQNSLPIPENATDALGNG